MPATTRGRAAAAEGEGNEAERPDGLHEAAGFYNRQGDFDKTIEALNERAQQEPNNPEAFHVIATLLLGKAHRDFKLSGSEEEEYIQAGLDAVDKALELKPDYFEALTYKNLLLRSQATSRRIRPSSSSC